MIRVSARRGAGCYAWRRESLTTLDGYLRPE